MEIEFQAGNYSGVVCDMLAYPVFEEEKALPPPLRALDKATRGVLSAVLTSGEFKPDLHRTCVIHRPSGLKAKRLLLLGGGKKSESNLAILREMSGTVVRTARAAGCKTVAFFRRSDQSAPDSARVATEGVLHGIFNSDVYKTRERDEREVEKFILLSRERLERSQIEEGMRRGKVIAEASNFARTLVNEPANILTPSQLAGRALDLGARVGLDVEILDRDDMQRLGMNALLAVSRGSDEAPKLIILRIPGQEKKSRPMTPFYSLIGKGVTFDSGGISLKPAAKMEEMKGDMAGGAAVLGAMVALAQLKPRCRVIGLIPAVENLPSGKAVKPGDVVKSLSGKTVEIINTDAEGRLIMADALSYARSLGATNLLDIATLTGACMVALGMVRAGVMGTDQKTIDRLRNNAPITGEKVWQLPLDDEYRKAIRSEIADIRNVGQHRWGAAITAAKFLQEFAEDTPWVHLDIAGMDQDEESRPYASKGATGFGVRSLIHLLS